MPQDSLARRERQIMDIIFAHHEASASQIRDALPDPPSYSAVRAVLRILEQKGFLRHKENGKQYIYLATTPRSHAARSALRRVLHTFFAGSIEQALATHLADPTARLSPDQLARITKLIQAARKKGE